MRHTNDRDRDNPAQAQAVRALVRGMLRRTEGCLHPDAPTGCDGIVNAHSLQRKGPLAHLKDESNHVYTFDPWSRAVERSIPDRVGWKEASTFRGVCHAHDQIFEPIESGEFLGTPQQVFLVSYRATYLEIHENRAAIAACDKVGYDNLAAIRPASIEERTARRRIRLQQWGRRKGLAEVGAFKATYDRIWRQKSFDSVASCVVWFDGSLSVASAGMVSPDYTVGGDRLQELHLPGMQSLAFGTVATPSGGAVVFTWPREMNLMARFVESMVGLSRSDLPGALVLFMLSYVSNTFFGPAWWDHLRPAARVRLSEAGRTGQQYYKPVNYRIGPIVDWSITRIDSV